MAGIRSLDGASPAPPIDPAAPELPVTHALRLIVAYLTTEAVRRKSPDIELGSHFSHFCAALGIPPTTGARGSLPMLRDQLQRLFATTCQCILHDESQGRHAGDGFLIAEERELWWDPRPGKGEGRVSLGRTAGRSTRASCVV